MQTTGNLGLKKPEGTDIVDIADLNGNMDILDNAVNGKVDKVTGKQLSTNDYTAAEKTKLAGIATGANNYVHPNHTGDVTSNGDGVTAIAAGVIVNADVNSAAGIDASKIGTGVVSNAEFGYLDGVTSGIQGQLNGKAPLVTTPQQTTADITYYVRTDGNDNNTGLVNTAGGAFRTIGKAVSVIPQIVNHVVSIKVAIGTYPEMVYLAGKAGQGTIYLTATGAVNINNCYVEFCQRVEVIGFTATSTSDHAFVAQFGISAVFKNCSVSTSTTVSGGFIVNAQKAIIESCTTSNRGTAIAAGFGATVISNNNTGAGSVYGLVSAGGACLTYTGAIPIGNSPFGSYDGGTIVRGFVINTWGDNTHGQRPHARVVLSSNQNLTAGIWTKMAFSHEIVDQMGNYDTVNNRFTASTAGLYEINVATLFTTGGLICELYIFANGNGLRPLDYKYQNAYPTGCGGDSTIYLNAGDYVEIFARSSGVDTLSKDYSFFEITRVA
ncbi:hypothetical protein [Paenibacillus sp. FSL R5-0470]|uniref:hypothetical protein n=1 Tax=Paenibacillus sp. FSL R5-0470 TaxID=2921641 RepID=UPI0030D86A5C